MEATNTDEHQRLRQDVEFETLVYQALKVAGLHMHYGALHDDPQRTLLSGAAGTLVLREWIQVVPYWLGAVMRSA